MLSEAEIINHPYVVSLNTNHKKSLESYAARIADLESRLTWLTQQMFGAKSEKRYSGDMPTAGEQLEFVKTDKAAVVVETKTVKEHQRRKSNKKTLDNNASESGLRFGPEVEVQEVLVAPPEIENLNADEYELIGERVVERLCQRKGAYYIQRFRQPKVKLKASGEIVQVAAPERVIDSSIADTSVLVGLTVDKFMYHMPLYRQHQRMQSQGIIISRATLTNWTHSFIDLFSSVYQAQLRSILSGSVLSIDESPHKAGRRNNSGKMDACYYWFLYGDQKEVCVQNFASRGSDVVKKIIGNTFKGVLLGDGAPVYNSVVEELGLIQANCWAHARRYFVEAEVQEPAASKEAVDRIREFYEKDKVAPQDREERLVFRLEQVKPLVDQFFDWLEVEQQRISLLPKTEYSKAVNYTMTRKTTLSVFLTNPDVPIDNNHTERAVRPFVLGRKNYLFCWSELGAEKVATMQSLILTCQLHQVDPWEYLTDVAQRISTHKMADVEQLIPRRWKELFQKNITA